MRRLVFWEKWSVNKGKGLVFLKKWWVNRTNWLVNHLKWSVNGKITKDQLPEPGSGLAFCIKVFLKEASEGRRLVLKKKWLVKSNKRSVFY